MIKKNFTSLLVMFAALLFSNRTTAQLYKVDMVDKVAGSAIVAEGKVTAQKCFWNPAHTLIYTANTVEIYKAFKGQPAGTIEVLTQGGVVGNEAVDVTDLAQLSVGDKGVFFLNPNVINLRSPVSNQLLYDIFSSDQGVLRYSIVQNKAYCPFEEYNGISTTFYNKLQTLTGRVATNINSQYSIDAEISASHTQRVQSGTISSLAPALVKAGAIQDPTNNILTISGGGFGNAPSGTNAILFTDGNNSLTYPSYSIAYNSNYIVSWTDAQIQVRVPARAANGRVAVFFAAGDTAYAPQNLNVSYGVLEANFTAPYGLKEPRLTNMNGTGGYSIVYSTATAGSGVDITTSAVYNTFRRALTTWKEISGINFAENGTTTSQVVSGTDGLNIIMLDNTNTGNVPLATGVLATTYGFSTICTSPSNAAAQKRGFDIVIRNTGVSTGTVTFENGPCAPAFVNPGAIDMETVILHELGHALNLSHVNDPAVVPPSPNNFANYVNPSGLMHYAVSNFATRRTPEASAYQGSLYTITPQSLTLGSCGLGSGEMIQLPTYVPAIDDCPLVFPNTVTLNGSAFNIDLVHATSNKAVDPQYTAVSCTLPGVSVTNNVYQAIRTNNVGGSLALAIANYATTPAEAATACTASTIGTGVRLSIYAVNSCPNGQAFPAPVACVTINGNGTLTPITGLQANTNYLLFFEGVRNTKATFSISLAGTALPLRVLSFTGKNINYTTNQLSLTIADAINVKTVEIERSADGIQYQSIQLLRQTNSSYNGTHAFADENVLKGANYYRVKTTDLDGKVAYSDVVKLIVSEKVLVTLQPNPFNQYINIKSQAGNKLTVVVADVVMKRLLQTTVNGSTQIPTARFAPGTYFISVYDAAGKLLQVEKMLKN